MTGCPLERRGAGRRQHTASSSPGQSSVMRSATCDTLSEHLLSARHSATGEGLSHARDPGPLTASGGTHHHDAMRRALGPRKEHTAPRRGARPRLVARARRLVSGGNLPGRSGSVYQDGIFHRNRIIPAILALAFNGSWSVSAAQFALH